MGPRYAGEVKLADLADLSWNEIEASLWQSGYAKLPPLLTAAECAALVALYPRRELFRSRIEMARYRLGVGDYQYFDYSAGDRAGVARALLRAAGRHRQSLDGGVGHRNPIPGRDARVHGAVPGCRAA